MNIESNFPQYPEKREISIDDKDILKQKLIKLQIYFMVWFKKNRFLEFSNWLKKSI